MPFCKGVVRLWGEESRFFQFEEDSAGTYVVYNGVGGHFTANREDVTIEKVYPGGDYYEAYDAYLQDNPPTPQSPCARLGFIDPEGRFYPCAYCCHEGLAEILLTVLKQERLPCSDYKRTLESRGWVSIMDGLVVPPRSQTGEFGLGVITDTQKRTLIDVLWCFEEAPADTNWFAALSANPEGYSAQQWLWSAPGSEEAMERLARERRELTGDDQ